MFYVYVLQSKRNGDIYIGYTDNLRIRFKAHNQGKVRSTKGYKPWILIYYEAYRSKEDAIKKEKQPKMHKPKIDLKRQLQYSLEV